MSTWMGIEARRGQRWEGGTEGVTPGLGLCKRRAVHRNMNGGLPALTLKQCFCLVSCGVLTCTAREAGTCSAIQMLISQLRLFFPPTPPPSSKGMPQHLITVTRKNGETRGRVHHGVGEILQVVCVCVCVCGRAPDFGDK